MYVASRAGSSHPETGLFVTCCACLCVTDLLGVMVLVLSVVGLLFSQALAMLSVFFASEVMPTVLRLVCLESHRCLKA